MTELVEKKAADNRAPDAEHQAFAGLVETLLARKPEISPTTSHARRVIGIASTAQCGALRESICEQCSVAPLVIAQEYTI